MAEPDYIPAARRLLSYLAENDAVPSTADAILGFGVFDLSLPRYCGELWRAGVAPRLLFTGGIGAGTGDFDGPEADVWARTLRESHPDIPPDALVLENRSTNTAENVRFSAELLERTRPDWAFGRGIRSAVIVASPSRLRRVGLTLRQLQPELRTFRACPPPDFEREQRLYEGHRVPYVEHLLGELQRLQDYPARGWIAGETIPAEILRDAEALRKA